MAAGARYRGAILLGRGGNPSEPRGARVEQPAGLRRDAAGCERQTHAAELIQVRPSASAGPSMTNPSVPSGSRHTASPSSPAVSRGVRASTAMATSASGANPPPAPAEARGGRAGGAVGRGADGPGGRRGPGVGSPLPAWRSPSLVSSTTARTEASTPSRTTPMIVGQAGVCRRGRVGGCGRSGDTAHPSRLPPPTCESPDIAVSRKEPRDPLMQSLDPRTPPGQELR